MMSEASAQFTAALIEAWNTHDLERASSFFAADYEGEDVGMAMRQHGPGDIRALIEHYLVAFPDLHFTQDTVLAQNDQIVLAWTARGTFCSPIMHIPPTMRGVEVRGVSVLTVIDQQVHHAQHIWDVAGLLRQIGLLPEMEVRHFPLDQRS